MTPYMKTIFQQKKKLKFWPKSMGRPPQRVAFLKSCLFEKYSAPPYTLRKYELLCAKIVNLSDCKQHLCIITREQSERSSH